MKKIIITAIAAMTALMLASCGNATQVNQAVNASKQEKIENMTYTAAAGEYKLAQMSEIGKSEDKISLSSFAENKIILSEDGVMTLNVKLADSETEEKQVFDYKISQDGIITLEDGNAVAASGEQIICNGKILVFSGNLGAQITLNMIYEKDAE